MQPVISSDQIKLRLKKSLPNGSAETGETATTLSDKLNELFDEGHINDDIYGLVIPLLMQGKVRIDIGECSERLELEDQSQKLPRSSAVQVFEDFLQAYRPEKSSKERPVVSAV